MPDKRERNPVPNNQNPDAPVGITNRDKEVEDARLRRQQEIREAQLSGEAPIGTEQGTTFNEMSEKTVRPIEPGYEAERGADIKDENFD